MSNARELVVVVWLFMSLLSPVDAGGSRRPPWDPQLEVKATVCGYRLFRTERLERDDKITGVKVYANGRQLWGSRNGPGFVEWYGRGVAISLRVRRAAGPAEWRVANILPSCSRVRLVLTVPG